jgi:sarcosine oxidase subunit beta
MSSSYDVIIIGAGIIGACTGLELARKGYRTLNIDKNPAAGYGSTSSSCAVIRTFYSTTHASALAYESWHYWSDWASYVGDIESPLIKYKNCGCLIYKTQANGQLESCAAIMDAINCPIEHLTAAQIKQRLPIIDKRRFEPVKHFEDEGFAEPTGTEISGGIFFPVGGYVNDPQLATQNVKDAATARGGTFVFNSQVVEILQSGGAVSGVGLANGDEIYAPVVVNVSGPHSGKVNGLAGVGGNTTITTRPVRQEVASIAAPAGFDFENKAPFCIDDDIGSYSRPESGNHMLVGTVQPACDEIDWVDDADDYNASITDQILTQVMRQAQRYPDLQIPSSINGLVALYDVSDDWNPIYDKSDLPGYYMAIGTSGNQFKNAPLVGKIMAQIIETVEAGGDHDNEPGFMALPNVNWSLPLATFSRHRKLNKDSSFSVLG